MRAREARRLLVGVEAAPGLAAEGAFVGQLAHAGGDVGADRVADRHGDVEAHEVEQCQRAERMGRAQLHALVHGRWVQPALLEQAHGAEQVGEEQAVDHEARQVRHVDGRLAQRVAQRAGAHARLVRGLRPRHHLDQLHRGHGVEDVEADEALGAPGGGGKIPLLPEYVLARSKEKIILRNFKNEVFEYPDVQEDHPLLKKGRSIEKRYARKKPAKKKIPLPVLDEA